MWSFVNALDGIAGDCGRTLSAVGIAAAIVADGQFYVGSNPRVSVNSFLRRPPAI
jgi:hypothetical protein